MVDRDSGSTTDAKDFEKSKPMEAKPKMIRGIKDIILIVSLQLLYLASFCAYTSIGPIYPLEAKMKGVNTTVSGLLFSAYPWIIFILSPIIGKYLPKLQPILVLFLGSFLEGAGQILFGFVTFLKAKWSFVLCSFLFRITTAVGAAFSQTAIIAVSCALYPDHVSLLFGMMELAAGAGGMLGPSIGGFMYIIGGFKLPFIMIGVFVWIMLVTVVSLLPRKQIHEANQDNKTGSVMEIITIPGVVLVLASVATAGISYSFFDSTIAVQLNNITNGKISKAHIGVYFVLCTGVYTVSAPIWGYIIAHKMPGQYVILIGHALAITSFILMGPIPFLHPLFTATPVSMTITACLFGIACAPLFVPIIGTMQSYAVESGVKNDLTLSSIVAGLYASGLYIGMVIGPTFGGLFLQYSTFSWACLILVILHLIEGLFLTIFVFKIP